ncbi:MAG: hypothetical protein ACI88A_003500 [Paraglaciecola sp.]
MQKINGILQPGHWVASGLSESSPYPAGTIAMQTPYFKKLGLDLSTYYPGTLNISIAPFSFKLKQADFAFKNIFWAEGFPSEDFSFLRCALIHQKQRYSALVYYPHPETKTQHFHADSLIEILCEKIKGISYGDRLIIEYDKRKIRVF